MVANFDISMILSENIPVYPEDPKLKIEEIKTISKDESSLSQLTMGVHTGTHIDAPSHFFKNKTDISSLSLDTLIGKTVVLEFSNSEYITASDLKDIDFSNYTRVLFKTRNSDLIFLRKFSEDYVYLDIEAADYLIKKGVKLVGFDYYSLDKYNSDMPVHKKLLENDVIIIEGLDLSQIDTGEYELLALPIKLRAEGAPARVVLRKFLREEIPS